MSFYFSPYVVLPLLSFLVNAGLAAFAWQRRYVQAALPLFWLTAAMGGWSLVYAANTASASLAIKIICYKLGTTFACIIVPSVLALSLESVGLGGLVTKRRLALVCTIPALSVILVWTSELHSFFRYDFYLYNSGPLLLLGFRQGSYYVLHYVYIVLINFTAMVIFLSGLRRSPCSEWPRFILMFLATIIPVSVSGLRLTPVVGFDMTTSTLLFSGICYAAAIFLHRLLDLMPVARDTLFEMMVEPVLVLDREGVLASFNRSACSLFVLDVKERGTTFTEIMARYPEMKEMAKRSLDSWEEYLLKEGPADRSWHVTKERIEFGGNLLGWIVVLRDITALQQTQEHLSLSDERFRTMAENSADTIWQIDDEYRIVYISNADCAMRGFAYEEVVGHLIFDIMNDAGVTELSRINAERHRQEQVGVYTGTMRAEVQLKCKDGGLIWTEINSNPLRNGEGSIIGYVGAIRDISERKKLEDELFAEKRKLLKTLSISDGYQAQLLELNSRIKRTVEEEERSRLYRDLHDGAGQSLQAVCLHLKMLADGRGGYDDPRPLAAQLSKEVADVAAELRDIAHQLRPSYLNETSLDVAITRRCEMLGRRGVPIDVVCEGDFITLAHGVSDNLYRIAQEAIANATRHANAGLVTVRLTGADNIVRLMVADNGCGMENGTCGSDGMGMHIMYERASLIGAMLEVSSSSSGTVILVTLELS